MFFGMDANLELLHVATNLNDIQCEGQVAIGQFVTQPLSVDRNLLQADISRWIAFSILCEEWEVALHSTWADVGHSQVQWSSKRESH